jgi:hypothetical protein
VSKDKKFNGLFIGSVENVDDDLKMGRIKVRVPSVFGDASKIQTDDLPWANGMFTVGGSDDEGGNIAIPRVGSFVYVQFIEGDSALPIYFNGSVTMFKENGYPMFPGELYGGYKTRLVTKRAGNTIVLDDDEGSITIKRGGTFITLSDSGISLVHKSGSYITINGKGITTYPKVDTPKLTAGGIKCNSIGSNSVQCPSAPCVSGGSGNGPELSVFDVPKNISEGNIPISYENGQRQAYSGTNYKK